MWKIKETQVSTEGWTHRLAKIPLMSPQISGWSYYHYSWSPSTAKDTSGTTHSSSKAVGFPTPQLFTSHDCHTKNTWRIFALTVRNDTNTDSKKAKPKQAVSDIFLVAQDQPGELWRTQETALLPVKYISWDWKPPPTARYILDRCVTAALTKHHSTQPFPVQAWIQAKISRIFSIHSRCWGGNESWTPTARQSSHKGQV